MKVLFIAQYGARAASSRTRVFDYLPLLQRAGVETTLKVVVPDPLVERMASKGRISRLVYYVRSWWRACGVGWMCLFHVSRYDLLFIQKVLFPFPIPCFLKAFRHKIVFDFDDAIFTTEAPEASWLHRLRTRRRESGLPAMLRASGHVVIENAYTAAYAKSYGCEVFRITGPIDTERYRPGVPKKKEEVVLGWIGSPTTTRYLDLIRKPLDELGKRFSHLRVCLIGSEAFRLDTLPTTQVPWSLDTEVDHLRTFDIGLMPLPDDAFTRGKGGYKLLQYLAMGIPVVASPVEINREIVEDGVNGFLAGDEAEWVDCLERLIVDRELRQKMGQAGREKMEQQYSLRRSSQRLLDLLTQVANR
ncbi:MAG: glycosyltransferase family 4 protein [bacterium]|nr:glycosyltransferase family 4 protein [bacterium]